MKTSLPVTLSNRRVFLVQASAASLVAILLGDGAVKAEEQPPGLTPAATTQPMVHSESYEAALKAILAGAEPSAGGLALELPELAENGNVVPYKLVADSPMTDEDYIKKLHLLSTANPQPLVASFELIPATGKATVAGRMRLAKTQDVVGIAEKSDGSFMIATAKVEVTIGGCGIE